jgi:hypothetical protein
MTREEEALRRALHAAADSLDPSPDGLMRIRRRMSAPRPLSIAWLMWLQARVAGWLEPARARLADAARPVTGPLHAWLVSEGPRHARQGPLWRRPAVVIAAVIVVAAAGGIMLSGLPSVISQGVTSTSENSGGNPVGGTGPGGANNASATPLPSSSAGHRDKRGTPASPSPSCSPSPGSTPSPTPSPTPTPTPTPSPSVTPSPTVSPQDSPSPSATDGGTGEDVSATSLTGGQSAAQTSPSPSPSPSC